MREKSRERGKGVGRVFGVESRSPAARFRSGSSSDLLLRAFKSRGSEISIFSSNRFASANFRIVVSCSNAEHFIFLDEFLLRWVHDVMQRLLDNGWKNFKSMSMRSGSRSLHLGSFVVRDVCFLKIVERCGNGKQFFILIPSDEGLIGWGSWLKSLQSVLFPGSRMGSNGMALSRSFAEVVGKKDEGISTGRKYNQSQVILSSKDDKVIVVDDVGVEARVRKLKCWILVCFDLGYNGFVAWGDFIKWLRRWWGVNEPWEKRRLGDDSWLIECESEESVNRIIQRGSWVFRGARLEVSKWFPEAGRSNLVRRQGARWILVFGVPVHLRSEVVFREIGKLCGGFLFCEETGFSAVRMKVKDEGVCPRSLFLESGKSKFMVTVMEEPACSSEVAKGKMPVIVAPSVPTWGRMEKGESSWKREARVPLKFAGPKPNLTSGSDELEFIESLAARPLESLMGLDPTGPRSLVLFNNEEGFRPGLLDDKFYEQNRSNFNFGVERGGQLGENEASQFCVPSMSNILVGCNLGELEVLANCEGELAGDDNLGARETIVCEGDSDFDESLGGSEEGEVLLSKGRELVALLDLHVNGSREEAVTRVEETTREVLRRRARSVPRSKKERELRRINWGLSEEELGIRDSARKSRFSNQ
ncbi:hypothetical protein LINPERPRIM_LOCUS39609 [Linum perenne]